MKVNKIELFSVKIPLKIPFRISLESFDFAENVFVALTTSDGLVGWGECNPFRSIHGETAEGALVVGKLIADKIISYQPNNPEALNDLMDKCIVQNSAIKSAFDMAYYDLLAQIAKVPLYAFLGGTNKKMQTDFTISLNSVEQMVSDAEKIIRDGFQVIKIKLGGEGLSDINRVKAIAELSKNIPLRLDANQGWQLEQAAEILSALENLPIEHCEEPLHKKRWPLLASLRKKTKIPIMADESCFDGYDFDNLMSAQACDRVNIKLSKSGGIFRAFQIIKKAEQQNIPLQMGGFLESKLGFTTAAHVAAASNNFKFYDFDSPLIMVKDEIVGGISYQSQGEIILPKKNGIGASPNINNYEITHSIIVK